MLASTHSWFECGQQGVCPYRAVGPLPKGWRLSGGGSPERHCRRSLVRSHGHSTFTSLRPFAPPELPGFIATMNALTPAPGPCPEVVSSVRISRQVRHDLRARPIWVWRALCHRSPQGVTPSQGQVSLFTSLHLRSIPSPTTPCRPDALSGFSTSGLPSHMLIRHAVPSRAERLGFRHLLAGSPRQQAESSSLALRTGLSPPIALHLPSQERSYLRLQGARRSLTRTPTSPIQRHHRRTSRIRQNAGAGNE
jgi:hypothetical protein